MLEYIKDFKMSNNISIPTLQFPFKNTKGRRINNLAAIPSYLQKSYLLLIGANTIHIPMNDRTCKECQ